MKRDVFRTYAAAPNAAFLLAQSLYNVTEGYCNPRAQTPVLVMVGNPEVSGDSLGPRIGDLLIERHYPGLLIGNSQEPIYGDTIKLARRRVERVARPRKPFVIAVDAGAATGRIGEAGVGLGPLHPGTATNDPQSPIGHIHLVGCTAAPGADLWQADRALVESMAQVITDALLAFLEMWDAHVIDEYGHQVAAAEAK